MDIRVFRYFITVAREENITKAAKILHITQPTLSRQLQHLEEELGVTLFKRSRHSIILTEKGRILLDRAKEIVALSESIQTELSQEREKLRGEISIGCGKTREMAFLAEQMAIFQKRYPLVRFNIYSSTTDDIKSRLENGTLDIGLLVEPVDVAKYEYLRVKEKDRWGIWTRKDSVLAQKEVVTADDLAKESLILPLSDKIKEEIISWFGDYSYQIKIAASYNLIINAATMVKKGIGTAISMEFDIYDEELCFIPLSPTLETGSVFVWKPEQNYSLIVTQFIRQLRNAE